MLSATSYLSGQTGCTPGAAGVAAAGTVARQGLRVVLLERYGFCGGGAVAGLSGTMCGMYEASNHPNARPNQIVHGFLDEFVQHLSDRGGLTPPVRYGKTFTRVHDPLVWRETADLLLRDAGVQVLLHTIVRKHWSRVAKESKGLSPTPRRDHCRFAPG